MPVIRPSGRARRADRARRDAGRALRAPAWPRRHRAALRLPPSLAYVAELLAGWSIGAQVTLLDHRLTAYEAQRAVDRVGAQVVVTGTGGVAGPLRGYAEVDRASPRPAGRPADTAHALLQLSSGSTGPSKVIGRTAADLRRRDRAVHADRRRPPAGRADRLLASMVHVLGLVGGLLYGLHAGVHAGLAGAG